MATRTANPWNILRLYWLTAIVAAWLVPPSVGALPLVSHACSMLPTFEVISRSAYNPDVYRASFVLVVVLLLVFVPWVCRTFLPQIRPSAAARSFKGLLCGLVAITVCTFIVYGSFWGYASHLQEFQARSYDSVQWRQLAMQHLYQLMLDSRLGLALIGGTYMYAVASASTLGVMLVIGYSKALSDAEAGV